MRDRTIKMIRSAWLSLGVAVLVLVLLEGVFQTAFWIRDRGRPDTSVVSVDRLRGANPGQRWVDPYHQELSAVLQEQWHSYVYWRLRPFHGEYINIDELGVRRTWNQARVLSPTQPKIFVFGGSTLWGYGARDEFTIPSLVSKKLAARLPTAPWVVNLGETGYVSTQEVITLMLELRKGNIPDLAVFYDGVNDAWAAFQSGVAGIPQNELNRLIEFNSRERLNLRSGFVQKSGLYRFARGLAGSAGSAGVGAADRRRFLDPTLANAVVDTYVGNVRLVKALARDYGFQVVFFWQPTIYSKKILSPDEERWRLTGSRRQGGPLFAEEYRAFNEAFKQRMKSARIDDVYDLSETFTNESRTIYIDRFHMSEIGNDAVAEAMVATLERIGARIRR